MTRPNLVRITRTIRFSAAHRYENPDLTPEQNQRVFGACYRPHGHGHNYRVDVTVEGRVDPVTGMVMNLADLDEVLQREIVSRLDHSFLNYDVGHFATVIPTCENLALYIADVLAEPLAQAHPGRLCGVRVWESDDLYAETSIESTAKGAAK